MARIIFLLLWEADFQSWLYRNYDLYEMITMAIGGAVIGLLQYAVLRRELRYSVLWIPVSILAWSLGLGSARWAIRQPTVPDGLLVFGVVEGAVVGMLTGTAMIFLLSHRGKS